MRRFEDAVSSRRKETYMTHTPTCRLCGEEGGASLKVCKSCMLVRYCNAKCQKNHWSKHKRDCKIRAAELPDEALFKDPPPKEDCPICFLPMPAKLISCISLPPATLSSVPIYDSAIANVELYKREMGQYYPCCGKSICSGCVHSFHGSGDNVKCPFCNSDQGSKNDEEQVEQIMKRVEVNDAGAIYMLAHNYYLGLQGLQQDRTKAIELFTKSADLRSSMAHCNLGGIYDNGGDMKKAMFHFEAAAMAGHEQARYDLARCEKELGNTEWAIKHLRIAASAGCFEAMHVLIKNCEPFEEDSFVNRESIDTTLAAYNNSCAEMRSESRDAYISSEI